MNLGTAQIIRANALNLPLPDNSVDLIVTSPPYFGLRSYQDGGQHYEGQIGDEPTPAEFVSSLLEVTRECMRVLKPSGSLWVNLGDSYAGAPPGPQGATGQRAGRASSGEPVKASRGERPRRIRAKQFTREDAAWLAGVIDSDGSVGIHINKQAEGRAPSFVPWVRIGQMRPDVVEHVAEVVGTGTVMKDGRDCWHWAASAQQARWVLERIHPWLLIKKRQAWAAIELARHIEARNAKGSWRQLTDDDIAYRQRLREAVMAWNKGGDDDLQVPDPGTPALPLYPFAPQAKSLRGIPHAYAAACVGRLGLILRAEVIWSKPNGLPESVTDRVRRSHEQWFHFVQQPRYFSGVDEVREASAPPSSTARRGPTVGFKSNGDRGDLGMGNFMPSPLGKLPGSVRTVPTEPLRVPDHLGVDHFAAFPTAWPKWIIQGWAPTKGVCTACEEGRRPVAGHAEWWRAYKQANGLGDYMAERRDVQDQGARLAQTSVRIPEGGKHVITGYACACSEPTADTRPAVILDPFGGTGTTALVAKALGCHGISVDMSADYCRLAEWRTNDPGQLAKVIGVEKPPEVDPAQADLFDLLGGDAA